MPCLVDGDFRCTDSTIIVDYLDEKWPDPPMLPKAPEARARARIVEELCDTSLEAINWGLMEIRFFRRAEGAVAEQMMARAGVQLAAVWDRLESELDGRAWMSGERFGRADASLIVHVVVGRGSSGSRPATRHPRLREWAARCVEIESVKRDQADLAVFMGGDGIRAMRKGSEDQAAVPRSSPRVDAQDGRPRHRPARPARARRFTSSSGRDAEAVGASGSGSLPASPATLEE